MNEKLAQGNEPERTVFQPLAAAAPQPLTPVGAPSLAAATAEPPNGSTQIIPILEKDLKDQLAFAENLHQYVRDYIRQADQKAAFFFAGSTALITFLHSVGLAKLWWKAPKQWVLLDVLSFVSIGSLAVAAAVCLVVVIPRLAGSKKNLISFVSISDYDAARDYAAEIAGKPMSQLLEAKLRHVHELARVCRSKYQWLRIGVSAGALGVAITGLLLFFS